MVDGTDQEAANGRCMLILIAVVLFYVALVLPMVDPFGSSKWAWPLSMGLAALAAMVLGAAFANIFLD